MNLDEVARRGKVSTLHGEPDIKQILDREL
jgi:hypothetical protein